MKNKTDMSQDPRISLAVQIATEAVAVLRELEYSGHSGDGSKACPVCCYAIDYFSQKRMHASDCRLANVLRRARLLPTHSDLTKDK